ncbi:hypothetical protein PKF023_03610 [Polynucleobacter yangtzensis]|uniref:Glycosyltransferase 2-like domain-containing protein n=1 Tax=Polynucleobacter yangtzensis TaxID=1743159 RepID=A0A9C7C462_9BURK|nr:glycosyltransferase [Polynucleobacter yangtzensis]BDT76558.1 hypothetical protein PKF023_03610 [Polynucleobacter yangtzensis]
MKKPLVSVLLCTNQVNYYLNMAIDSILNQTFDSFELIIIANGLADDQFDLLGGVTKDERVRIYRTSFSGLTFSLNLGLHYSIAPFVARMDADDIAYPTRLAKQYELLRTKESICVCGSWIELIDPNHKPIRVVKYAVNDAKLKQALYFSNPFCHPSVMVRKSAIQSCGGYMGGTYAEDYDLWVRLARDKKNSFANIPEVLLGYRAQSIGYARGSAQAYASVSGSQWSEFVFGGNVVWFLASCLTLLKRVFVLRRLMSRDAFMRALKNFNKS